MRKSLPKFFAAACLVLASTWCSVAVATVDKSGSWFDPSHNGEGFIVQYIDDSRAVIYWFTYDEAGAQRWFTGMGTATGNTLHIEELLITDGGVFGPGFDPNQIMRIPVGELTLTFSSDSAALAAYTINGVTGQQNLLRLTRTAEADGTVAPNVPHKSGSWYDPTHNGEGFVVEVLPDGRLLAYWFTYDLSGRQAWMMALSENSVGQGSTQLDLLQPVGGRFGPDFDPDDVTREPVGTVRIGLECNGGFQDYKSTDPADFVDIRFNLERIVGIGQVACNDPDLTNLFPLVDGEVAIPDHVAGRHLRWLLDQTAGTDEFSDAMIMEHFSDQWLAQNSIEATRTLLEETRATYPAARLTDPVATTSTSMSGVFTANTGLDAYFVLNARLGEGKITNLGVYNWGYGTASVVYANDANLNLEQAADKFASLSAQPSLLLARINADNQCEPLVTRDADELRSIASIFKIWILAGVVDAIEDESLLHDQVVPLDGTKKVGGGPLNAEPAGMEMTIDELSTLMLGVSDNTATDMLHGLAGRSRIDALHAEYGHQTPEILAPQLGISEQFHLFFSFPEAESRDYVNGTEAFQQDFLTNRIVPLGSRASGGGGYNNESLFIDGAWQASPMDICGAFARHRLHAPGSDAALLVERALQAGVAQPNVREKWDRVWYKGGSLVSGVNGTVVLTHAFMLEKEGKQPIVLVGLSNNPGSDIDGFAIQSILGRFLELAAEIVASE